MRKKRLLLVDDEEAFGRLLKLNLEEAGSYEVSVETDGTRAVASARAFQPDLILLDVIMPDTDGGAIGAEILADHELKKIPIIYLTAAISRKELRGPSGIVGGRLFVAKPVDKQMLVRLIEEQLAKAQLH
ncbi:MAG TPA: response regulator [Candidatus Binatia bacterium]|nr:response regulator [Candidatus Binatia bacterium]